MMNKPRFRRELFWDVDPATIHLEKNARYVIERILDFGNEQEVRWMASHYPARRIRDTLRRSRSLHKKSKALWPLVFR